MKIHIEQNKPVAKTTTKPPAKASAASKVKTAKTDHAKAAPAKKAPAKKTSRSAPTKTTQAKKPVAKKVRMVFTDSA